MIIMIRKIIESFGTKEKKEKKEFSTISLPWNRSNFYCQFSGNIGKKGKEEQGLHAVVREGGTSGRCLRGRHARADDLDTWQSLV